MLFRVKETFSLFLSLFIGDFPSTETRVAAYVVPIVFY